MIRDEGSVVPLLVGVIGPRDIDAAEERVISDVVGSVLTEMSDAYPHSDVAVVTSVAAGTDTVAAIRAQELGCPVYALLPLDIDDYAQDFVSERLSLSDRLELTRAWWVGPTAEGASRDARYQACGRLLARLSGTLLAAWNGVPPRKPGGTADTLYFAVPEVAAQPDLSGRAATLTTERGEVVAFAPDDPDSVAVMDRRMSARRWLPGSDPVSRRIDAFNRDSGPGDPALSAVLALQQAGDSLASRLQARYRRWTASLLVLGVLTIVSVDVQAEISRTWFLGVQIIAFVILLAVWWLMNRSSVKRRFEEYRALAEGARVQEAWQHAGIEEPLSDS